MDVLIAVSLLVFIAPLMILIALMICRDGGPLLFGHTRIGLGGKCFTCWKLRSMVMNSDEILAHHLSEDTTTAAEWDERRKLAKDPRVTPIGQVLRACSIDEVPQLFNVVRGDMSLVGPRPVMPDELDLYYGPSGRAAYISVRPGITGLWQVSGRSQTTYAERVELDIRYVAGLSLLGDLKLLALTIPSVLRRQGAV